MKGIWLEAQRIRVRDGLPEPPLGEGEARIRVLLAGICGTDLELTHGYYPFTGIPGHEFVGEVIEAPSDPAWVGERVVGEINVTCGSCAECAAGRPRHCLRRTVLGIVDRSGAFAEALMLPVRNLHRVPEKVADDTAVFTEPLAAALEIIEQIRIDSADRVLLIGAGRLGQLIARVLARTGCKLTVVARYPGQRRLLEAAGIEATDESHLAPERSMDIVVEATGRPEGFALAQRAVRPRGTIVIKSTYAGDLRIDISAVVVDELTIVGSRCGPFAPASSSWRAAQSIPLRSSPTAFPSTTRNSRWRARRRPGCSRCCSIPPPPSDDRRNRRRYGSERSPTRGARHESRPRAAARHR